MLVSENQRDVQDALLIPSWRVSKPESTADGVTV